MGKTDPKVVARQRRKKRFRKKTLGSSEKPRLCVYRSNKHIFAQVIDDQNAVTLVSCSTLTKDFAGSSARPGTIPGAKRVGELLAQKAISMNIRKVIFDRNGFLFHGRVKALADGAREAGLQF